MFLFPMKGDSAGYTEGVQEKYKLKKVDFFPDFTDVMSEFLDK